MAIYALGEPPTLLPEDIVMTGFREALRLACQDAPSVDALFNVVIFVVVDKGSLLLATRAEVAQGYGAAVPSLVQFVDERPHHLVVALIQDDEIVELRTFDAVELEDVLGSVRHSEATDTEAQ